MVVDVPLENGARTCGAAVKTEFTATTMIMDASTNQVTEAERGLSQWPYTTEACDALTYQESYHGLLEFIQNVTYTRQ